MGWLNASHFSHVSASAPGGSVGVGPFPDMRSLNGGGHGFAGWRCFRQLPETGVGLRTDDGRDSLSDAGSSLAAADLRLAELRSVSEISGAAGFSHVLAGEARRPLVQGDGGTLEADQAGRTARR